MFSSSHRLSSAAMAVALAGGFVGLLLTAVRSEPLRAQKDDEKREVRFSFPANTLGVDLGRDALVGYIERERLGGDDIVDRLFDRMPLGEMARVLRTELQAAELAALDAKLEDIDLAAAVRASSDDETLASKLEAARVDDGDVVRGLRDVFEDFFPVETAAYWVQHGYNEHYVLARLKQGDDTPTRLERIERSRERDIDRPSEILREALRDADYDALMTLYLGLAGRPQREEFIKAFEDRDKVFTPELERILSFGEPSLAAAALRGAGIEQRAFADALDDVYDTREDGGGAAQHGRELLTRLIARENAPRFWLRTSGDNVRTVYEGRASAERPVPILGPVEGNADPKSLADFGISAQLLAYFRGGLDLALVLYNNGAARARILGVRYEGRYDEETKTLELAAVYGGGKDRRYRNVRMHGKGLLMELELVDAQPDASRVLLRRARAY